MRFGIMEMQLEALVPPGVPAEQIMAGIIGFDHAGLAKSLFEKGFNPIELGGDLGMFLPQAYQPEAIQKLMALKTEGLTYTLHLPLWSVEPSTPLTPVRDGSVEAVTQIIQATSRALRHFPLAEAENPGASCKRTRMLTRFAGGKENASPNAASPT